MPREIIKKRMLCIYFSILQWFHLKCHLFQEGFYMGRRVCMDIWNRLQWTQLALTSILSTQSFLSKSHMVCMQLYHFSSFKIELWFSDAHLNDTTKGPGVVEIGSWMMGHGNQSLGLLHIWDSPGQKDWPRVSKGLQYFS